MFIGDKIAEIFNLLHQLIILILEFVAFQTGQLTETHFHDSGGLDFGEAELVHQAAAGLIHGFGGTNQRDNLIDDVESFQQAFEDMGTGLGFFQIELGAAQHH